MKSILKWLGLIDTDGNTLHEQVEITASDGDRTGVFTFETVRRCECCPRLIFPKDQQGICFFCERITCSCATSCQVCSRNLCGDCRRGVATAQLRLTVCPICQGEMERSLNRQERRETEHMTFQILQHSLLDRLPGIGFLRQYVEMRLLERLIEVEDDIER